MRVGGTLFFPTKVFGAKLTVPVYLVVSFGFCCFLWLDTVVFFCWLLIATRGGAV
jgi:hypothetical protein